VEYVLTEVLNVYSLLNPSAETAVCNKAVLAYFLLALEYLNYQLDDLFADFSANHAANSYQNYLKKTEDHVLCIIVSRCVNSWILYGLLEHVQEV